MREHGRYDGYLYDNLYRMSLGAVSPGNLLTPARADFRPVTGGRPFFFHFAFGLPEVVSGLLAGSLPALVFGWLAGQRFGIRGSFTVSLPYTVVFSLLGMAFMLAEIPLMQKFTLFLGRPMYSTAVLLISVLAGAAAGSAAAGTVARPRGARFTIRWAALAGAVLIALSMKAGLSVSLADSAALYFSVFIMCLAGAFGDGTAIRSKFPAADSARETRRRTAVPAGTGAGPK